MVRLLRQPLEFEWDAGNSGKNLRSHRVTDTECEEVFFDPHKRLLRDTFHAGTEARYVLIGATRKERILFVIFTIRRKRIRVISARDLNRKERYLYPR